MTSHDVVGRIRRLAGTRKVGHAGTLDPMATGVLVIGVNKATRLLTYIVGHDKTYTATIRLGQSTVTDDAEGDIVSERIAAAVTDEDIEREVAKLRGTSSRSRARFLRSRSTASAPMRAFAPASRWN